ncbi:trypco2 family protein [Dactylosporangium sp. NPDC005555]|uniref:trypco2 family protein n=1 Tax=Dactylosporangium sp. NPDC005555 TaxID=3154889 RepID=UPI0033A66EAE
MQPISANEPLSIPEAMESLRSQLLAAIEDADGERLTFAVDAVEVQLQMTVSTVRKAEGRLAIWSVVTAGGGVDHTRSQVHTVKLTLQPTLHDQAAAPAGADPRVHIADDD